MSIPKVNQSFLEQAHSSSIIPEALPITEAKDSSDKVSFIAQEKLSEHSLGSSSDLSIQKNRFDAMFVEDVQKELLNAAEKGQIETLKEILASVKFQYIPSNWLRRAFLEASDNNHPQAVQLIMNNPRFQEISAKKDDDGLASAFAGSALHGRLIIMKLLMDCDRFQEILDDVGLEDALSLATLHDQLDAMKLLMESKYFNTISADKLSSIFQEAASLRKEFNRRECSTKAMQLIMNCPRFNEISVDTCYNGLGGAFFTASSDNNLDAMRLIMNCSRFHEMPNSVRREAFISAATGNSTNAMRLIMNCDWFSEEIVDSLSTALQDISYLDESEVKEALHVITSNEHFKEIPEDEIEKAILRATVHNNKYTADIIRQASASSCCSIL